MKTNIATDSLQSQRLLRCGVSADTADMCWYKAKSPNKEGYSWMLISENYLKRRSSDEFVPAWSLSALLSDILPMKITDGDGYDYELQLTANISEDDCLRWELFYYSSLLEVTLMYVETPNPIEAAVEMIEQLTNNGYKLNEQ